MSPADQYRTKASELRAKARFEPNAAAKEEWEKLAQAYLLLAIQADRNSRTDVSYETPP